MIALIGRLPAKGMRLSSARANPPLQKADTEWKADHQSTSPGRPLPQVAQASRRKPRNSATTTTRNTARATDRRSLPPLMPRVSATTAR